MKQSTKYVGLIVHQATIVAVVGDDTGRVIARSVLPTEAGAIREFVRGMRGAVHVAFEAGTQAVAARPAGPASGARAGV